MCRLCLACCQSLHRARQSRASLELTLAGGIAQSCSQEKDMQSRCCFSCPQKWREQPAIPSFAIEILKSQSCGVYCAWHLADQIRRSCQIRHNCRKSTVPTAGDLDRTGNCSAARQCLHVHTHTGITKAKRGSAGYLLPNAQC